MKKKSRFRADDHNRRPIQSSTYENVNKESKKKQRNNKISNAWARVENENNQTI